MLDLRSLAIFRPYHLAASRLGRVAMTILGVLAGFGVGLVSPAVAAGVPAGSAAAAATPAPAAAHLTTASLPAVLLGLGQPTTATLSRQTAALLADPIADNPALRWLAQRRAWLARREPPTLADFWQVAKEFEDKGAYYPALEILWFVEKGLQEPKNLKLVNDQMRALKAKTAPAEAEVDAAMQMWAAGRRDDARAALESVIAKYPYCEVAYYQLGHTIYRDYQATVDDKPGAPMPPLATRTRTFRECYARYRCTLAIDPLYKDAWYQISVLRDLLPDQRDFLAASAPLSRRAVEFQVEVVPRLEKLDNGDRSAKVLSDLSDALATVGLPDYAILSAEAALNVVPAPPPDLAKSLKERIAKLRKLLPPPAK